MFILQGKGVSPGIAHGPIYRLDRSAEMMSVHTGDVASEKLRFISAQREAAQQLDELAEKCRSEAGNELALLFETHALLAQDDDLTAAAIALIESGVSAAEAAKTAGEQLSETLRAMNDEYMRARSADIIDVSRRISECAAGRSADVPVLATPSIVAADDLTPSETLQLDRSKLLGFITYGGSPNSHTAILARALGIPAICGAGDGLNKVAAGQNAYIDGGSGTAYIEPDTATISVLEADIAAQSAMRDQLSALRYADDLTGDGRKLEIWCNIGSPEDISAVIDANARGIGLLRSEFLYLGRNSPPDEEEQYLSYRRILEAMRGRKVIVRTLDIGADKRPPYYPLPREENPAMGMRGIRICLDDNAIFRTQLRALYRASAHGELSIMFPMITSVSELEKCRTVCARVIDELRSENIPISPHVPLGIMIETPAAVLIADELAKQADFFSIGTNDLTQYLLACDRQSGAADAYFDPRHPSLLQAVRMTADAAHRAGIWVGICGEAAADSALTVQFLDMGIDEISVSPSQVLEMRAVLRKCGSKQKIHT